MKKLALLSLALISGTALANPGAATNAEMIKERDELVRCIEGLTEHLLKTLANSGSDEDRKEAEDALSRLTERVNRLNTKLFGTPKEKLVLKIAELKRYGTKEAISRLSKRLQCSDAEIARLEATDIALRIIGRVNGFAAELHDLLENEYVDPNAVDPDPPTKHDSSSKYNLLQRAVRGGHLITISLLVDAGANDTCLCPTHGDNLNEIRMQTGLMSEEDLFAAIKKGKQLREQRMTAANAQLFDALSPYLLKDLITLVQAYHRVPITDPRTYSSATIEEVE